MRCEQTAQALTDTSTDEHRIGAFPGTSPDDPNGWLWQICRNLRRTPEERLQAWTAFSDWSLKHNASRWGLPCADFSPRRVIQALTDHHARFVMVGMGAGYLQGVPYPTKNTDIMPDPDPENVERSERALLSLNASPLKAERSFPVEKPVVPGFDQLFTSAGMVNIVEHLPGVGDYQTVKSRASLMDIGECLSVRVADIEHVIRSKETLGRRLDALHVLMCKETLQIGRERQKFWKF